MARTPANAWGRLELEYTAYAKSHIYRVWVLEFDTSPGVGNFIAPGTPASLDALATALTSKIGALFNASAGLAFGAWQGIQTRVPATGSGVTIVEGTITPGSYTASTEHNDPGDVSQQTWSFRDPNGKIAKQILVGAVYPGSQRFVYSTLGANYKAYADYITGSSRVVARSGFAISSFIDLTCDTNDGLTRRYRR